MRTPNSGEFGYRENAMRRRQFLKISAAAALAAAAPCRARCRHCGEVRRTGDRALPERPQDRRQGHRPPRFSPRGPAATAPGNVYFTNTSASQILKWDGKQLAVFREDKNAANGLLIDPQGRLVACEGGSGRVTRTDLATGKIAVLVDQFGGHPLGAPNDLCFDRQGRIYFTSRLPNTDPAKGNVNAVYRIDPDGKVSQILHAPDIDMPNGIVTSPDDKILYLVESDGRADHKRCILAFDLAADGTVSKQRKLIDFYPGRSGDGMAIDERGNLYIAAGLHKTRNTVRDARHAARNSRRLARGRAARLRPDARRHDHQLPLRRRGLEDAVHHLRHAAALAPHADCRQAALPAGAMSDLNT